MFFTFRVMEVNQQNPMAAFGQQLGIVAQLYTGLIERLLAPHGLTWPQFTVLVHLARRKGPARISDIARAVELTQPAVTKIAQKFEGAGWVAVLRDPNDQRNRLLALTEPGSAQMREIQQGFGPAFARLASGLTPEDLERITVDLARLAQALDALRRPVDAR
jgi:MarR family transcriptional regulator, transcriptional regulator for hemolysin